MTDQQWYDLTNANYEKVAADLVAKGYTRRKVKDFYQYHFTQGSKTLVIVRKLGNPNWHTKELLDG